VLSAAVEARPLEQQWWKWLKSAVDAAAAAAAASASASSATATAAATSTATVCTDVRTQQQQQSSGGERDDAKGSADKHTASAAAGDTPASVHSSSGSELLCTELRKREHLAPVLRARLLQAAAGWGGLHALAAVDTDDSSNSSSQVSYERAVLTLPLLIVIVWH
jgi:hypothetical protein